ncbi:hypothetical protein ACFFYR_04450 [Paraburkholderia dipogonis]|uniref:hypothetical protein n=1 Tax=Paraburkholderia dipogonis TaxID=1211383 RepID=UPI00244D67BD|nr:hypothetical protein [Paraburkholderia dipogonis]
MQQLVAQLPWFHLCTMPDKVKNPVQRDWHAAEPLEHGWSSSISRRTARNACMGPWRQRCHEFRQPVAASAIRSGHGRSDRHGAAARYAVTVMAPLSAGACMRLVLVEPPRVGSFGSPGAEGAPF